MKKLVFFLKIFIISQYICLCQSYELWSWGLNNYGQLGLGDTLVRNIPTQIGKDADWIEISTHNTYNLAIKSDSSLWAWGYGRFGLGDTLVSQIPIRIGKENDWKKVSANVAIKTNGSLWKWGYQQIGTDTNWVNIVIGRHTLALKTDRSLWAWGDNSSGQLGDGTDSNRNLPVQIGKDLDWQSIKVGLYSSLALKTDGSIWAWGEELLGDSTIDNSNIPIRVGKENDWQQISGGNVHNMALKKDGSLWAWGDNSHNQLGSGSGEYSIIPIQIGKDKNWKSIEAGYYQNFALKIDGSLWVWGSNRYGGLGNGTGIDSPTPIMVTSESNWHFVSQADYGAHTIALRDISSSISNYDIKDTLYSYVDELNGEILIKNIELGKKYSIQLFNSIGSKIDLPNVSYLTNQISIPTENLQNGVYFITLIQESKTKAIPILINK